MSSFLFVLVFKEPLHERQALRNVLLHHQLRQLLASPAMQRLLYLVTSLKNFDT